MQLVNPDFSTTYADIVLTVDLSAISRNYTMLADMLTNGTRCAAVLKSNAYGLGTHKVAPALHKAGCDIFFVATLDEAIALRKYINNDVLIYVLHGLYPEQAAVFLQYNLRPVLNDFYQLEAWVNFAHLQKVKLNASIHIDTGLCRLGFDPSHFSSIVDNKYLKHINIDYVLSHLSCSRQPTHEMNDMQLTAFNKIKNIAPQFLYSISSSGGMFLGSDYHCDLVRAGCSLYGIAPTSQHKHVMHRVITLTSRILQIHQIEYDQPVGYGATYIAKKGSIIATVAIGYGDGYLRSLANVAYAYINNYKVPVVGLISMDLITINVTDVPAEFIYPGAEVELIGPNVLFNDILDASASIGYELLTRLGPRVRREYLE